jgi:hypothetical protein
MGLDKHGNHPQTQKPLASSSTAFWLSVLDLMFMCWSFFK